MAPPAASKNFKQEQPITTTLRNVCESYSSSTCLRELLQNADDARATEIEYVLDTNTYSDSPLMYDELREYHGPALLARNNSIFTDQDFNSLSSVGDSGKRYDPAATGKFGLGFNSVYHWTDGPWVYSRNLLLMLDPHKSWSRKTEEPQGPTWDVVANSSNIELQNHMKTFSAFNIDHCHLFDQTIIRIPLRTETQAKVSKIVTKAIDPEDIEKSLKDFCQDVQGGGILFLKHIRKVIVRINDTVLATAEILENSEEDAKVRKELTVDFRRLYSSQISNDVAEMAKTFQTNIRYLTESGTWTDEFIIRHSMARSSGDAELDAWARELKLFPWVAIAAPLNMQRNGPFVGTLFSTLSLHIPTEQPVHMHGLFAIAPDRARLGRDETAIRWNFFLFKTFLSRTWASLLAHPKSKDGAFALWPRTDISHKDTDLWTLLDDWVIDGIFHQKAAVWNTINRDRLDHRQVALTVANADSSQYCSTWTKLQLPIVVLQQSLYLKVKESAGRCSEALCLLTPKTMRVKLIGGRDIPDDAATSILEYCFLDAVRGEVQGPARRSLCSELQGIRFWPTLDGSLATSTGTLLLPRDDTEMQTFSSSRRSVTVDLEKLTPQVRELFWNDIGSFDAFIRHRRLQDLADDWPNMYHCQASNSFARRMDAQDSLLSVLWTWIQPRLKEEKHVFPESMSGLWLIPVNDLRIRQLFPGPNTVPTLINSEGDQISDCISAIIAQVGHDIPPVLDTTLLGVNVTKALRKAAKETSALQFAHKEDLKPFTEWLVASKMSIARISAPQKIQLLTYVEGLVRAKYSTANLTDMKGSIRQLPLFSRSVSVLPYTQRTIETVALDSGEEGHRLPSNLPPLPNIQGLSFYDPSSSSERYLVENLRLLPELNLENLLMRFLLPWMEAVADGSLLVAKEAMADWTFQQSFWPSSSWLANVITRPIVPLPLHGGVQLYRCLKDLVDLDSQIAKLYFADESVFPSEEFFQRNKTSLRACGISNGAESLTVILRRAKSYSQRIPNRQLVKKVKLLLKAPIIEPIPSDFTQNIRSLKWMPTTLADGTIGLSNPSQCRGADQSQLVDNVWGITEFFVEKTWSQILGWDQDIPKETLLAQLDLCLQASDVEKVDAVLKALKQQDLPDLISRNCILGRNGSYMLPRRVFFPGTVLETYSLAPFIDQVSGEFAKKHGKLLDALDVKDVPSTRDLQELQNSLSSSEGRMGDAGLRAAISVLEVAVRLGFDPIDFKIPDTSSCLQSLPDIVYGDRHVTGTGDFNFVNPALSGSLIKQLGVENSFARATRLKIDFEDEDEDEYIQEEKLTTVISDTLERYPIESTFNEYLANADDAGATRICFTIDECRDGSHASQSLLTSELARFQGPALIIFNDKIFSEKNFAGFKDIGQGGKSDDATTTGMFGRGALSMYHFTDMPVMISDRYFLILDPQQEFLPRNKHFKRKAGIKLPLSVVRRVASDHLAPFHRLHGYDKDQENFPGTIFRFPFRAAGHTSKVKQDPQSIDHLSTKSLLDDYLDTARISLLFLQTVSSIEFSIRGRAESQWCVFAERFGDSTHEVFNNITISTSRGSEDGDQHVWRVGVTDIEQSPANIPKVGKGHSKISECGIAALLLTERSISKVRRTSSEGGAQHTNTVPERVSPVVQRIFCRLPIDYISQLPVSLHASFAITGDRKTIAFDRQDSISLWNNWLLTKPLVEFYLEFLKDVSKRLGQDAFRFWPSQPKSETPKTLSSIVTHAFWSSVTNDQHRYDQIYPAVPHLDPSGTDLTRPSRKGNRKIHGVTAIEMAHFDFLTIDTSTKLRPLFNMLNLNLVRPPPRIRKELQDLTKDVHITKLNSSFLCKMFKEEKNCRMLEDFLSTLQDDEAKIDLLAILLRVLIPRVDGSDTTPLHVLDGCRILPRPQLNVPLGLLTLNPQDDANPHLLLGTMDQELFAFASKRMVNTQIFRSSLSKLGTDISLSRSQRNPIHEILKAPFNIRNFDIGDVGTLLALPESPSASGRYSEERDKWTKKFWERLNCLFRLVKAEADASLNAFSVTDEILLDKANIWDHAIYRVETVPQPQYITPRFFTNGACIVNPTGERQKSLCSEIGALRSVDPTCVTFLLVAHEGDLEKKASFQRFLKALGSIQLPQGYSLKQYLNARLSCQSRTTLRKLSMTFLSNFISLAEGFALSVLRSLPVWPRFHSVENISEVSHIAAEDAAFCKYSKMFMPWAKNLVDFVNPAVVDRYEMGLGKLGVHLWSVEKFWTPMQQDLPKLLVDHAARKMHMSLVQQLRVDNVKTTAPIAPNGLGILCKPDSLYDHEDALFQAAFREEDEARYVHPQMRSLRPYWLFVGLRARSAAIPLRGEDFLQCASAIDRRWTSKQLNNYFHEDAANVSSYLHYPSKEKLQWSPSTWEEISKQMIFKVKDSFEDQPGFRRSRMSELAKGQDYGALQNIGRIKDIRISWSLVTFHDDPPNAYVFERLPHGGRPSVKKVYKHLQFLVDLCQDVSQSDTSEYLSDIQACYHYLQDYTVSTKALRGIRDARIWFNLETLQTESILQPSLLANLLPARSLCLKIPAEIKNFKIARNFLIPYEKLLNALGCQSLVTVTLPIADSQRPSKVTSVPMAKPLDKIRTFKDQGQLTDITFEAEGRQKHANRNFLAASSIYCHTQFLGEWSKHTPQKSIVIEGIAFKTLSTMVDFGYTEIFTGPRLKDPEDIEEVAEVLDELLDLLEGSDRWHMEELHHQIEDFLLVQANSQTYIRVDNVVAVKKRVGDAQAKRLLAYCDLFIEANATFVEAYEQEERESAG